MSDALELDRAAIERLALREFGQDADAALALLAEYGSEDWHREALRVQAAAMYLAEGNLEELGRVVAIAKRDYRDILFWAEFPNYNDGPDARAKDTAKYRVWLRQQQTKRIPRNYP